MTNHRQRPGGLACHDCGLPYSDPAWLDAAIPDEDWLAISPTGHEGGVLCITCMTRRLARCGRSHVPVRVFSGANTLVMAGATS